MYLLWLIDTAGGQCHEAEWSSECVDIDEDIGVNTGNWDVAIPRFWDWLVVGDVGLHEILLYLIMYKDIYI